MLYSAAMQAGLLSVDWIVVIFYFSAVAWIGLRSARGQASTRDYFLGGRSLPWWAASLSIIATETSAVTLMGTPRKAFEGDWSFLQFVLGLVLGRIFLAFFFIHVFYRQELVTVYGYLEQRFGDGARCTAALIFLAGRVIGSGVRLYAGCLALEVAAGIPIEHAIVLLGAFGTIYTLAGGIRAVVWTDVLLGLTFMAAGVATLAYLGLELPGGASGIWNQPDFSSKVRFIVVDWNLLRDNTLLAGLLGGFFLTIATHGTDQDVAQRLLTCKNSREGILSVLGSAFLILPLMALFLAVGTGLYFFHRSQEADSVLPANLDHLFPLFIVKELPTGVRGFVMAGLLAATVSSFTSVLNALASTVVSDFYLPWKRRRGSVPSEARSLFYSRVTTLAWGAILVLIALGFRGSQKNVLDLAYRVLNYFYGALLGAFSLGIFTRRGTGQSVMAGMLLSVAAVLACEQTGLAYPYWIIVGTAVTIAVGALGVATQPAEAPQSKSEPEVGSSRE